MDDFTRQMEAELVKQKDGILAILENSGKTFVESASGADAKDEVDAASDDIDKKMIEALGAAEMKRLKLIENAIMRIKNGKYGLCVKCGARIPKDRLAALPYALLCVECKAKEERKNR